MSYDVLGLEFSLTSYETLKNDLFQSETSFRDASGNFSKSKGVSDFSDERDEVSTQ